MSIFILLNSPFIDKFTQSASAATFGSIPLDKVISAAAQYKADAGISSTYEFAAIILAPTWFEIGASQTNRAPAPMGVGRSDVSVSSGYQLWVDGKIGYESWKANGSYYRCYHWTAGVGLWQLDSAGLGKQVAFYEAVDVEFAAKLVAKEMARLYKGSSATTAAGKRKSAWTHWYACRQDADNNGILNCEQVFNEIFKNGVLNITRDSTISQKGGLQTKTCYYDVPQPSLPFTCYKFDATLAEGNLSFWTTIPDGSYSAGLEPLPAPFYVYTASYYDSYTGTYKRREIRVWLKTHSGYDKSKQAEWAGMDTNARGSVYWSSIEPYLREY